MPNESQNLRKSPKIEKEEGEESGFPFKGFQKFARKPRPKDSPVEKEQNIDASKEGKTEPTEGQFNDFLKKRAFSDLNKINPEVLKTIEKLREQQKKDSEEKAAEDEKSVFPIISPIY